MPLSRRSASASSTMPRPDPTRPDAARGSRRGAPARGRRPWRTTAGLPPGDRGEPGGDRELDGVEPSAWLTDVLERTVSGRTEAHELEHLLPWNRKAERLEAAIDAWAT
jgi:hypothetical protein